MFCPKCGNELSLFADKCISCGKSFKNMSLAERQKLEQLKPIIKPQRKSNKRHKKPVKKIKIKLLKLESNTIRDMLLKKECQSQVQKEKEELIDHFYLNTNLGGKNMLDFNELRNEQLIKEREEYENDFISMVDIIKSGELDYYAGFQYSEYYLGDFDIEFDMEDYFIQLRDEKLIREREAYELEYYSQIAEDPVEYDALDIQIESYEGDYYECDFEYFEYDDYFDSYYEEHSYMEASYCGNHFLDYIPNDDLFDNLDGCDYPEGPDENLLGFKFPEPEFEVYFEEDICIPEYYYECQEIDLTIEEQFIGIIEEYCNEELQMQKLIKEHLEEEKFFLQSVPEKEVLDKINLPPECDDLIFI